MKRKKMKKINVYITQPQYVEAMRRSIGRGMTFSEYIRRALDIYARYEIEKKKWKGE